MRIAIITNEELKTELLAQDCINNDEVYWLERPEPIENCDCYVDLLFEDEEDRIELLKKMNAPLVLVNDVSREEDLPASFVAFNGWRSFLKRPLVEIAENSTVSHDRVDRIFSVFGKKTEWVPDQAGFITARVVAMVINEAYLALGEGVSTREEIDTAMKLGTNYPHGPFEWATLIGIRNVYHLLKSLSTMNDRYQPAALLEQEAQP